MASIACAMCVNGYNQRTGTDMHYSNNIGRSLVMQRRPFWPIPEKQ